MPGCAGTRCLHTNLRGLQLRRPDVRASAALVLRLPYSLRNHREERSRRTELYSVPIFCCTPRAQGSVHAYVGRNPADFGMGVGHRVWGGRTVGVEFESGVHAVSLEYPEYSNPTLLPSPRASVTALAGTSALEGCQRRWLVRAVRGRCPGRRRCPPGATSASQRPRTHRIRLLQEGPRALDHTCDSPPLRRSACRCWRNGPPPSRD